MGNDSIKRYTDIPFILQTLHEKKLALLNPKSWDDKNDAHYMLRYKQKKQLKGVFALCLTEANQTYHHWKVFTHGASGACIHFRADQFQNWVNETTGLTGKNVEYKTIRELTQTPPTTEKLPFLKRYAYQDEAEYRLLHESSTTASGPVAFSFPCDMVERIVLNPWLPSTTVKSIKELIQSIKCWESLSVIRATIVRNEEWRKLADTAQ
jgi:hypothetical protein